MSADLSFRMQLFIAGTPERVWEVLTSSDLAGDWWDPILTADWRAGGEVIYGRDDFRIDCKILEIEPPHRLVTTFDCDAYPDHPPTRVTWEIEPVEGGCMLRMVHDQFPSSDSGLDDVCQHWPQIIAAFKRIVEGQPAANTRT